MGLAEAAASVGRVVRDAGEAGAGGCGVLFAGFLKREVGLDGIFAGITGIFLLAGTVLLIGYRYFIRTDIARARLVR